MLCYKDLTFCKFYARCEAGRDCPRACTPAIESDAYDFGLPIYFFSQEPDCFIERSHNEDS